MAKVPNNRYYQKLLAVSRRHAQEYVENYRHNYGLYNSTDKPRSKTLGRWDVENINEVYPIIELQRVGIGFRYPKVSLKPKRPRFFIKRVRGNPKRKSINEKEFYHEIGSKEKLDEFDSQVLQQMINQGTPVITLQKGKDTIDYIILDGKRTANIIEQAVNQYVKDKGVEDKINKVKDDALMSKFAVAWVDYYCPYHLPVDETEFIKEDNVIVEYLRYGRDFLYDSGIDDISEISKAKWVARRHWFSIDDMEVLKEMKRPNGKPLFKSGKIDMLLGNSGKGILFKYGDNDFHDPEAESIGSMYEPDGIVDDIGKDDRMLGYHIWQFYEKPSLKERMDENSEFKYGKCRYVIEGFDEDVCDPFPWTKYSDEFPCEFLCFNIATNVKFPTSDIEVYEPLLAENNIYKALKRDLADISARFKMILDKSGLKESDINELKHQLADPNKRILAIEGFTKDKLHVLNATTQSNDLWGVSNQTVNEIQKLAMTSNTKLQQMVKDVSATAEANAAKAATQRESFRQYIFAKFWSRIVQKIIALMQQYYDSPRMVSLTGQTGIEWVMFTRDLIQGEFDVDVDVLSMNPNDIMFQIQQIMNLLNLMIGMFDNPRRYLKLVAEGRQVNLSELILEIIKRIDIANDKIFPQVSEQTRQLAEQVLTQQIMVPQGGGEGGFTKNPNASDQVKDTGQGTTGAVTGPYLREGAVMPPGGDLKV